LPLPFLQLRWIGTDGLFAGLIGLGFGASTRRRLSSELPFRQPAAVSSLAMIAGIGLLWLATGAPPSACPRPRRWLGGVVLAGTTTLGALLQWLIRLRALAKQGLHRFLLFWDWAPIPGVREVLQVMGRPQLLPNRECCRSMCHRSVFRLRIVGAAAGLGYANRCADPAGLLLERPCWWPLLRCSPGSRSRAPDGRPWWAASARA